MTQPGKSDRTTKSPAAEMTGLIANMLVLSCRRLPRLFDQQPGALKCSEGLALIYFVSAPRNVRARCIRSRSLNITKPAAPRSRSSAEAMTAR